MITRPTLPPKAGYVEVIRDGKHVYKNVQTGEIFGQETDPGPTDAERIKELEEALELLLSGDTGEVADEA